MKLKEVSSFRLEDVLLTDKYYINASKKEMDYLLSFDIDKLLAGFRDAAGLDMKDASRYDGWEDSLIGGHTLGHYLTACSQAYRCANSSESEKKQLLSIIKEIVDGLKECQDAIGTGFIFGAVIQGRDNIELQFDNVENGKANIHDEAWVPWYTMHKIISGLLSASKVYEEAFEVASKLGDWVYKRVSSWSLYTREVVLSIEYGGMNDCLYDMYSISKDERHAKAAHLFDETPLFDKVLNAKAGDNVLNDHHANTTIPKFMGALNRYIVFKDNDKVDVDVYLEYSKAFWDLVINNHTYITGGNSEWEHFGEDNVLAAERTNCNNETCNSYNMLILTKKLFMITGDVKYADYYENAFLNSIMSSQNPETGMTMYFQPMASGYFKVFGERYNKFWCCVGSGMENFTKLGESFYFYKENTLIVNQYISSELDWSEQNVKLIQESMIPDRDQSTFRIKTKDGRKANINIAFRLPDWLASAGVIKLDGKEYSYISEGGYGIVEGPFEDGSKIQVQLPMEVKAYSLPDNPNVYGFKYGPVVLSALLGSGDMEESTTGMNVTIPLSKRIDREYTGNASDKILVQTDSLDEFTGNINTYMVRDKDADGLVFDLEGTKSNLKFTIHYSQYKERYGIYWELINDNS